MQDKSPVRCLSIEALERYFKGSPYSFAIYQWLSIQTASERQTVASEGGKEITLEPGWVILKIREAKRLWGMHHHTIDKAIDDLIDKKLLAIKRKSPLIVAVSPLKNFASKGCVKSDKIVNSELPNIINQHLDTNLNQDPSFAIPSSEKEEKIKSDYFLGSHFTNPEKTCQAKNITAVSRENTESTKTPELPLKAQEGQLFELEPKVSTEIPPSVLMRLWNDQCGDLLRKVNPNVKVSSPQRIRTIGARLKEMPNTDYWQQVFAKIMKSKFCLGTNQYGWKATFDWVIKPGKHAEIMEGKYENSKAQPLNIISRLQAQDYKEINSAADFF